MTPTMALKRYHETRTREAVTRLLCPDLWRARRDSNPQPTGSKPVALSS
jgi:hypothetical protein